MLWKFRLALVMSITALTLAGCKDKAADPNGLALPSAQLMEPCDQLVDIPKCEAQAKCRTQYYGTSRSQYAACSDKTRRLQQHARIVSGQGE